MQVEFGGFPEIGLRRLQDVFYTHLQCGIAAYNIGKGTEHEPVKVEHNDRCQYAQKNFLIKI